MLRVQDARFRQRGEGRVRPFDMELVARRPVERVRDVRPHLGRDSELGEKRERTSRGGRGTEVEVEIDGPSTAEMHDARRMEERRELCEAIAALLRRNRGKLRPDVLDEGAGAHRCTPSRASSRRFSAGPAAPYPPMPFAAITRWHGMISE